MRVVLDVHSDDPNGAVVTVKADGATVNVVPEGESSGASTVQVRGDYCVVRVPGAADEEPLDPRIVDAAKLIASDERAMRFLRGESDDCRTGIPVKTMRDAVRGIPSRRAVLASHGVLTASSDAGRHRFTMDGKRVDVTVLASREEPLALLDRAGVEPAV